MLNRGQPVKLLVITSFDVVRSKISVVDFKKTSFANAEFRGLIRYIERNCTDYIQIADLIR